jgi:hypothetical protein
MTTPQPDKREVRINDDSAVVRYLLALIRTEINKQRSR